MPGREKCHKRCLYCVGINWSHYNLSLKNNAIGNFNCQGMRGIGEKRERGKQKRGENCMVHEGWRKEGERNCMVNETEGGREKGKAKVSVG